MFGSSTPAIQPTPPIPRKSDREIQARTAAERKRLRDMKGRRSTVLTGGQGLQEEATVGKKSLLGQ